MGWNIIRQNGWHTYWKHPGDVGVPPSLDWNLPKGFEAQELIYCPPTKVKMGNIRANGNYGETLFLSKLKAPSDLKVGEIIPLKAKASWLACSLQCLPGFADLNLEVEVVDEISFDQRWRLRFEHFRQSIPKSIGDEWKVDALAKGSFIELSLKKKDNAVFKGEVDRYFIVPIDWFALMPVNSLLMMRTRSN